MRGIGSVADEHQPDVEAAADDIRERAQNRTDPFFRGQLAEGRKHNRLFADPQLRARRFA